MGTVSLLVLAGCCTPFLAGAARAESCKACNEFLQACVKAHSRDACKNDYDICMKHCRAK